MNDGITDPNRYVQENKEILVRIIKHGDDEFTDGRGTADELRVSTELVTDPR